MRVDRGISQLFGIYTEPSFIIAGAQKGGTTSLYSYLVDNPQVKVATQKEIHFFDLNYERGLTWYRKQFPTRCGDGQITGEASPYYLFHPEVPQRIAEVYPDIKIIAILRNPVDRAFSHYNHNVKRGHEHSTFEDAIDRELKWINSALPPINHITDPFDHQHYTYLSRGMYATQLKRWHEHFPRRQILVLKSENLFLDPSATLDEVFDFLQLTSQKLPQRSFTQANVGTYTGALEPEVRNRLVDFFRPHNDELHRLTGIDASDWQT